MNIIGLKQADVDAATAALQAIATQQSIQQQMDALLSSVINEILTQLQANNTIAVSTGNTTQSSSIDTPSTPDPIAQWQDLYSQLNPS
jgi:hypothetical protein